MLAVLKTFEYLQFDFARQGLLAALAVATASATLSTFVVLKKLSFVGQGISHAAFGGLGVAAILGLAALPADLTVLAFCLFAALVIGALTAARSVREDSAIGIVLVAAMALGSLLFALRTSLQRFDWYQSYLGRPGGVMSWESVLFGSIQTVGPMGVVVAWIAALIVLATVFLLRRPLLFFAFDEVAAEAAGVATTRMRATLMVLLALLVVVGMKLVGVVLISALLVLPGAIAAQLTRRLWFSFLLAWLAAVAGVLAGLLLSFEFDQLRLPSGPCIVLMLAFEFGLAFLIDRWRAAHA